MENIKTHLNNLLWLIPPVAIFILLLMNDVVSVSSPEEVGLLTDIRQYTLGMADLWSGSTPIFPKLFLAPVYEHYGLNEFALRLPGVLFIVTVLFIWWLFGKRLLGESALNAAVLVVCTTILLPNIVKYATADVWLLGWQLLTWLSLLFVLKKPAIIWHFMYYVSLVLGLMTTPLSMGVWVMGLLLVYYFKHEEGGKLKIPILSTFLVSVLLLVFNSTQGFQAALLVSFGSLGIGWWLGAQLTGFIPWFGFMLAGLKESYDKYKRGEELSVLMAGALLAGMLSGGLVLQWVLALLAGKQLLSYFHPKYPYGRWVKAGAVLVVVLSCLVATTSMIWGYVQFSFEGYRAFMITGSLFWIISLVAVIGLYINNYRLIALGFMMSGLLLNFGFWYRIVPVAEESRGWVKKVIETMTECQPETAKATLTVIGKNLPEKELKLYAGDRFQEVSVLTDSAAVNFNFNESLFLLIDSDLSGQDTLKTIGQKLTSSSSVFRRVPEVVFKACN